MTLATLDSQDNLVFQPLPTPSSITVQIFYDPTLFAAVATSGYTTTYQYTGSTDGDSVLFSIVSNGLWPTFSGNVPISLTITAPPPGQGPDSMEFYAMQQYPVDPGYGGVDLVAPNGTLASSLDVPTTLAAFRGPGSSFDFTPPPQNDPGDSIGYFGLATGTLVPEPASIVSMTIGLCAGLPCVLWRRRMRARRGRCDRPASFLD